MRSNENIRNHSNLKDIRGNMQRNMQYEKEKGGFMLEIIRVMIVLFVIKEKWKEVKLMKKLYCQNQTNLSIVSISINIILTDRTDDSNPAYTVLKKKEAIKIYLVDKEIIPILTDVI